MKRLISTVDLPREEWLKVRRTGLTGTDIGAITGMNPYSSAFQVYHDKLSEETEDYDNEAMRQGRDLEEYVARRFTEETGLKVRKANAVYQNEEYPFMLADFDRLVVGQKAGLECKTVSAYSADKWSDGRIPLHYQMQVQHYLAVSGFDTWYIAALIMGREFVIRKIERDEELIRNLIIIEKRFWEENVVKRIPPDPDGSRAYSDMLLQLYSAEKDKEIRLFGMKEQLVRRAEIEQLVKKLETEKEQIDQSIKLRMQDASYAVAEDYRIFWTQANQNRIDAKRLKEEQPEIYDRYAKEVVSRRFCVKYDPAA